MNLLARLWNAGIVGKLSVGFLALVLSCCVLGAVANALNPRTASIPAVSQPTDQVPIVATSAPAPTSGSGAAVVPASSPTIELQPSYAPAEPSPQPAAAATPPTIVPTAAAPLAPPADLPTAAVVRVIDGDTVDVRLNGQVVRLRLIGIDTPEIVDPRKAVQCFGREASAKAHELLDGQTVALEADPSQDERDRYGRLLRYVWLSDGRLFNREMVAEGYAFEYTYDLPYKYQAEFKQAEHDAREAQRGLWSSQACAGEHRPAEEPVSTTAPRPQPAPNTVPPPAQPTAAPAPAGNCDPAYPDVCIPPPPPDLDCGDIPNRNFRVLPPDPHRFDRDKDGIGCEN
jgi:micrococcal nuclease